MEKRGEGGGYRLCHASWRVATVYSISMYTTSTHKVHPIANGSFISSVSFVAFYTCAMEWEDI